MRRFDAIVVGAGPAGSTTAYRLARAGATVALVDRSVFPRDKPCGGGVTGRAARLLPCSIEPVVEDVTTIVELRFRYGKTLARDADDPLVYMTQRRRLDHFLVQKAADAGAELREGLKVTRIEAGRDAVVVQAGAERLHGHTVIGADGANGVSAKALRLGGNRTIGVAVEGNAPYGLVDDARYRGRVVIEFGTVGGGYGWVFPKADHVNVGVGGWGGEKPNLRAELERICGAHGFSSHDLRDFRGHRLPLRAPDSALARGRAAIVGDAAGLIDPVSADGMFGAFLSSGLVSEAVLDFLGGRAEGLEPYSAALLARLGTHVSSSWTAKSALDRFPRTAFTIASTKVFWRTVEDLVSGAVRDVSVAGGLVRAPLMALTLLARVAHDPGVAYRT